MGETAIVAIATALITGVLGVLGTLVTARASRESLPSQYQQLTEEMREWTRARLEERDVQIERLQGETAQLRSSVSDLEAALDGLRGKFRVAIGHIGVLRERLPPGELPPVPVVIREDLDGTV